jgi:hypothetical protein
MSNLQDFLADMALDPEKFENFLRDPNEAIGRAGLSDEDRDALLSGIPAMIWARLAQFLAFPPPYYTPATDLFAGFPRPNFVTMPPFAPMPPDYQPPAGMPGINFVTRAMLYVTAVPPLYLPGSPNFVTTPPPPHAPEPPPPAPPPTAPRTPTRKRR